MAFASRRYDHRISLEQFMETVSHPDCGDIRCHYQLLQPQHRQQQQQQQEGENDAQIIVLGDSSAAMETGCDDM